MEPGRTSSHVLTPTASLPPPTHPHPLQVLFLCTANVADTIPGPLLDRMEVVRLSGYILSEKVQIAEKYLLPQAREQMGLTPEQMEMPRESIVALIRWYCREAGVRNLQKQIERICRKVALKVVQVVQSAEHATLEAAGRTPLPVDDASVPADPKPAEQQAEGSGAAADAPAPADIPDPATPPQPPQYIIGPEQLAAYVGKTKFTNERIYATNPVGVVTGLAWTSMGGAVLYIETASLGPQAATNGPAVVISGVKDEKDGLAGHGGGGSNNRGGGNGSVRSTGQLGDVMRESSLIAHTFARNFLHSMDPTNDMLERTPLHLHVPEGATPKDGPSAGVTMVTSMLSVATATAPRSDVAMTGEVRSAATLNQTSAK